MELLVFFVRHVGDEHGRFVLDQAHQADGSSDVHIRDEQFLAVDEVHVSFAAGRGPEGRQIGTGARFGEGERGEPFAGRQFRQIAGLLIAVAERLQRIDGADATVDRGQPGDRRIELRHLRQKRGESRERHARPTVVLVDQQAPIAGLCEFLQHRFAELAVLVVQGVRVEVLRNRGQRIGHHLFGFGIDGGRGRFEQLSRYGVVPDGSMDRTVDRLVLRRIERLDLIIGLVDGAGPPDLVFFLAAQPQRHLGEIAAGRLARLGWRSWFVESLRLAFRLRRHDASPRD